MKPLHTIILFIICVSLGAYIYLFERHQTVSEDGKVVELPIQSCDQKKVDRLSLTFPDNREIGFELHGDSWRIAQPLDVRADSELLKKVIGTLCNLTAKRKIEPTPEQVDRESLFGLDQPQAIVRLFEAGMKIPITLTFGKSNAINYSVYIRKEADPVVYSIGDYVLTSFNLTTDEFRERTLIPSSDRTFNRIRIAYAAGVLDVSRDENAVWRMNQPWTFTIDALQIAQVISELEKTRIEKFLDDDSATDTEHFSNPVVDAQFFRLGREKPDHILIGDYDETLKQRFARLDSDPFAVMVSGDVLNNFIIDPKNLFEKNLLTGSSADFSSLIVTRGSARITFTNVDGLWSRSEENMASVAGEKSFIPAEIISQLTSLQAQSFYPQRDRSEFHVESEISATVRKGSAEFTFTLAGSTSEGKEGIIFKDPDYPPTGITRSDYDVLLDKLSLLFDSPNAVSSESSSTVPSDTPQAE